MQVIGENLLRVSTLFIKINMENLEQKSKLSRNDLNILRGCVYWKYASPGGRKEKMAADIIRGGGGGEGLRRENV
jgi:hypothetical protein